jgi:hypothetical protein
MVIAGSLRRGNPFWQTVSARFRDRRAAARDDNFLLSKWHSGQITVYSSIRIFCHLTTVFVVKGDGGIKF